MGDALCKCGHPESGHGIGGLCVATIWCRCRSFSPVVGEAEPQRQDLGDDMASSVVEVGETVGAKGDGEDLCVSCRHLRSECDCSEFVGGWHPGHAPWVTEPSSVVEQGPAVGPVRETVERTVRAVLSLMDQSSGPHLLEEMPADCLVPHSNGYGTWFCSPAALMMGTAPLSVEEIANRVERWADPYPLTTTEGVVPEDLSVPASSDVSSETRNTEGKSPIVQEAERVASIISLRALRPDEAEEVVDTILSLAVIVGTVEAASARTRVARKALTEIVERGTHATSAEAHQSYLENGWCGNATWMHDRAVAGIAEMDGAKPAGCCRGESPDKCAGYQCGVDSECARLARVAPSVVTETMAGEQEKRGGHQPRAEGLPPTCPPPKRSDLGGSVLEVPQTTERVALEELTCGLRDKVIEALRSDSPDKDPEDWGGERREAFWAVLRLEDLALLHAAVPRPAVSSSSGVAALRETLTQIAGFHVYESRDTGSVISADAVEIARAALESTS